MYPSKGFPPPGPPGPVFLSLVKATNTSELTSSFFCKLKKRKGDKFEIIKFNFFVARFDDY